MKKVFKKTLAMLLAVIMVFGAAPLSGFVGIELPEFNLFNMNASAATYSGTCGDNLTWTLDTDTGELVISGTGEMIDLFHPCPWYEYRETITKVTINDGVTSIGGGAFLYCTELTSITIPDSVTTIGESAFSYCTELANVTIPDSVTAIEDFAFNDCTGLTSIVVDENNKYYSSDEYGALFNKNKTTLIQYPVGNARNSYVIPDSVTSIESRAFAYCSSLTSVTISNSVTTIGDRAFNHCSGLTDVTVPDSVTAIGSYAFAYCSSLISVTIGNSVTTIGDWAFFYCNTLTNITINSVTSIGYSAFEGCTELTSITIPDGVTSIGGRAFYYCESLESITIPDSVTTIGESAFSYCTGLTSIVVDENNKYYSSDEYGVLFNKNKTTLIQYPIGNTRDNYIIPDSVISIGVSAFLYCTGLANITIPDSVTTIGDTAFSDCTGLANITIPDSVTTIGESAFSDCTGLANITIPDSVTAIGESAFSHCTELTSITIPDSVTSIGSYAFEGCTGLTSITIPDGVTSIGGGAFLYCTELTSITIPDSVTTIGGSAFLHCTGLANITIPDSVTTIGESAFSYCAELANVTIPDSVTSIGNSAFEGCAGLTSITIPDSVTSIGNSAFEGCTGLTSITIPDSVTTIGESAFSHCTGFTSITIPDGVTGIGNSAFAYCAKLEEIVVETANEYYVSKDGVLFDINMTTLMCCPSAKTECIIPDSVTTISSFAFGGCTELTSIVLPANVKGIEKGAFSECGKLKEITVKAGNENYVSKDGVLFDTDLTTLVLCPAGKKEYTIPDSVTSIGSYAFYGCTELTSITIPENITDIGHSAFYGCTSLVTADIKADGSFLGYFNSYIFRSCTNLKTVYLNDIERYIDFDAVFADCENLENVQFSSSNTAYQTIDGIVYSHDGTILKYCPNGKKSEKIVIPSNVTLISAYAFADCSGIENFYISNKKTKIGVLSIGVSVGYHPNARLYKNSGVATIYAEADSLAKAYAVENRINFVEITPEPETPDTPDVPEVPDTPDIPETPDTPDTPEIPDIPVVEDIYNIGEETYSFDNFVDNDSWGHCFGMSATSSAYYIGELDITGIGGDDETDLYELTLTTQVKTPICYYQAIQGSYSVNATVAGGSYYKNLTYDIESDWEDVVNYVKSHEYDNKGSLQIGYRKDGEGGHAINFLRYEEVNGQARIYVYDNNFPDTETYFYQDPNGDIRQAPFATFSGAIDCIALRDVSTYFGSVGNFDSTRFIYAERDAISVEGVEVYPIDGDVEMGERVMFEIPADVEQVTITPLVDNAEFTYLDKEYSFGDVDDDTVGILKLASTDEGSAGNPEMTIVSKSGATSVSIRTPSTTTISYGDSIVLHAETESTLPNGYYIEWTADNGNFSYTAADGGTCTISPESSGDTTFTAAVVDAEGNVISSDTQEMTSKAGFFQKIIAFFKMLFGLTKVIPQMFMGIY